jgi:prevent-host-death family protein
MQPHQEQAMKETQVGTRELKSRLSEYMRRVKAGQTIIVTERGKVIGQIVPVKPSIEERLRTAVTAGIAEWNEEKPKRYSPAAINKGRRQVSDLVVEDRE